MAARSSRRKFLRKVATGAPCPGSRRAAGLWGATPHKTGRKSLVTKCTCRYGGYEDDGAT